jgi:GTPase Era involved in 16S rRNA processing
MRELIMNWKQLSAHYQDNLDAILKVQSYALDLAKLPQARVDVELIKSLRKNEKAAYRQLERLRKGEFRIAVVGLEKAGKSTFINAWLESDLLPSKAERCTFTTTQIYSVSSDSEQRLEVQVRTDEQFEKLLADLKEAVNLNEKTAKLDLEKVEKHQRTLAEVRLKGNQTFRFQDLDEIKENLAKYVADEQYAHSILEVRLYTSKLVTAEGIVFYDVPGSDSGLSKHINEAREMLSDCDTVIFIQRNPSITGIEGEIIQFAQDGDESVSMAEKVFVFLSRIDSLGEPEAVHNHVEAAVKDWQQTYQLPRERIVYGSAGAYLVLNNIAGDLTRQSLGSQNKVKSHLSHLMKINDEKTIATEGTGIPEIKKKVNHYINTERVIILQKRCNFLIDTLLKKSEAVYSQVIQYYSDSPDEAKRIEEDKHDIEFSKWWGQHWKLIQEDLQKFSGKSQNDGTNKSFSKVQEFRQRYIEIVELEMLKLRQKTLSEKDNTFAINSIPSFDRNKANYDWREGLYQDVTRMLSSIAEQLAVELQAEATELVDYMSSLLWDSKRVRTHLFPQSDKKILYKEENFLDKLENSLSVLFLRFARPIAESIIRGPVNSDIRKSFLLNIDIETVPGYYKGNEEALQISLRKYVNHGFRLIYDVKLREELLESKPIKDPIEIDSLDYKQQVELEIMTDVDVLEEYLKAAIFDAAGFEAYCVQELRGLIDTFISERNTWNAIARIEWRNRNPKLLDSLPIHLKTIEVDIQVSERLKQLSDSLKKYRNDYHK